MYYHPIGQKKQIIFYLTAFFLWNDDQSTVKAAADYTLSFNALINNDNSFTVSAPQQSVMQFYVVASWWNRFEPQTKFYCPLTFLKLKYLRILMTHETNIYFKMSDGWGITSEMQKICCIYCGWEKLFVLWLKLRFVCFCSIFVRHAAGSLNHRICRPL